MNLDYPVDGVVCTIVWSASSNDGSAVFFWRISCAIQRAVIEATPGNYWQISASSGKTAIDASPEQSSHQRAGEWRGPESDHVPARSRLSVCSEPTLPPIVAY